MTSIVSSLTVNQIQTLSTTAIANLSSNDVASLTTAQIKALSSTQLAQSEAGLRCSFLPADERRIGDRAGRPQARAAGGSFGTSAASPPPRLPLSPPMGSQTSAPN